ncbi:hypothetical protein CDAR_233041 [Caerostris darwini]|uniref:Uncharacterized protein n=1 Tax=Caerostris darwini TaxID=1538125 RepID=A0AAV4Q3C6_9ARAC|nr:hypothetical protein CDAR_233041 [Caerostris darwini]
MASPRTTKNHRLVPNPISLHTSRISKELPQESILLYSISSSAKNEKKRRTHSPCLPLNPSSAITTSERIVPEGKLHYDFKLCLNRDCQHHSKEGRKKLFCCRRRVGEGPLSLDEIQNAEVLVSFPSRYKSSLR